MADNPTPAPPPPAAAPLPIPPTVMLPEEARQAERQRIQSILELPEAQGRADLARTLAFEPGMTPEGAKRILAAAPAATAAPPANPLEREMAKIKNPVVGMGSDSPDSSADEAQRILAFLPAHQRVKVA